MTSQSAAWAGLTLAQARELRFLPTVARDRWRALLDIEMLHAVRRNRELLGNRKPTDVRSLAEAILDTLPEEDPEVVMARRAILLDDQPADRYCPCGREAHRGGEHCGTHRARVLRHGDPLLHIPVTSANNGGLLRKDKAA